MASKIARARQIAHSGAGRGGSCLGGLCAGELMMMMMMMVMVKAFARGGGRTEPSGAGVCVSRLVTCSRTELYSKIWAIAPCAAYVASKLQASPA